MGEQFIPRKERHKKQFFKRQTNKIEGDNIKFITYLKCFIYYFLLFSIFGLVHIYLDQKIFHHSLKLLTNKEIFRCILAGLIYVISYLCVVDTYYRFNFDSVIIKVFIPVLAFILSFLSMLTLLIPHL